MKRKYDLRNKRNLGIILVLAIIIIIIFSLFIYKYKHTTVLQYEVAAGSVLQDNSKNYLNITEDAILKVRWNDNYLLNYQDKMINLGKNVIIYNTINGSVKLYGKFYEINETGKINPMIGETVLNNTTDTKFYKLGDREYLLIDRQIVSDDRSINANNYLLVELDKMGNAKLSNDKLNLKTITPTTLVTSKYTFDIANEVLKYGELEIDLKKIIGSSNEYVPSDDGGGEGEGEGETPPEETPNEGVGGGGGDQVVQEIPKDPLEGVTIEELKDKVKMSSVVNYQAGLTTIDIDYIIYDPYNEYKQVYAEITKSGRVEKVVLSKTESHAVISDLAANTSYKINFMYTLIDYETGETKDNKFDEITVKTNKPSYSGKITGIYPFLSKELTYSISLDTGCSINSLEATVTYYCDEESDGETHVVEKTANVTHNGIQVNEKTLTGRVKFGDCKVNVTGLEKVKVTKVTGSGGTITFN